MQKKLLKFLRSMTFGMIVLGLILLCSFPGSVIAQGNTPDWYVQTYPDWHGVILKLGLDDVFGSWYFIALLALLCLNLTLCSLIRIRNVVKTSQNASANAAGRKTKVLLTPEGTAQLRLLLEHRHYKKEVFGESTPGHSADGSLRRCRPVSAQGDGSDLLPRRKPPDGRRNRHCGGILPH